MLDAASITAPAGSANSTLPASADGIPSRPRRRVGRGHVARVLLFAPGDLALWLAFSAVGAKAWAELRAVTPLSPAGASTPPQLSAGILLLAGAHRFGPVKPACLVG